MDEAAQDSAETLRLLEEAQGGDSQAFEQLFARYRPELRQAVEFRLGPELRTRVDPSDVVQEAEMEAFRRMPDFLQRRPMPFRLWLRKTAYERLGMLWRQHVGAARRSVRREVPFPDQSSQLLARQLLAPGATPIQQLDRAEREQRVSQAVARLAEIDREVLLLRNYEGLSYEEVGFLLDIDPATARKRHGRALLRLHTLLGDSGQAEAPS
jgi:RNA polymerase sigma-70 factor (ECF subfamily)